MLPCYLWQLLLHHACSLQSIHGCCGMRLQQQFWDTHPNHLEVALHPSKCHENRITKYYLQEGPHQHNYFHFLEYFEDLTPTILLFTLFFVLPQLSPVKPTPIHFMCLSLFSVFFPWLFLDIFISPCAAQNQRESTQAIFVSHWGWTFFVVDDPGSFICIFLLTPAAPSSSPSH